jgi:predicted transcriptional regulator
VLLSKGLVSFRREGRQFIYRAEVEPEATRRNLLNRVLEDAYCGAVDRLVAGAISLKSLKPSEVQELQRMLSELEDGEGD